MNVMNLILTIILGIVAIINLIGGIMLGWTLKEHSDKLEAERLKKEEEDHEKILKAIDEEYENGKIDDDLDFLT